MTKNYTFNDLVRYIYRETSNEESFEIRQKIETDEKFKTEYLSVLKGFSKLSDKLFSPENETCDFILSYSRNHLAVAK